MAESQGRFPVPNNTYNLMQSLVSKLEAVDVYQRYLKDANDNSRSVFQQLLEEDRRHAEMLLETLRQELR